MKNPYTNEHIFALIDDFCENSCVIKDKNHTSTFTVNELLYVLENVAYITSIELQINTEMGMYIPCTWKEPYFVDSSTRRMQCKITGIEPFDINDDEDNPDWEYLIIIKTWTPHN